ncbi:hypothetical protein SEA_SISKO_64 [Gordonia phage Sisko]|nr:hypothetical protein SEA_SISKO_64 [Gordonia phage Sisko]
MSAWWEDFTCPQCGRHPDSLTHQTECRQGPGYEPPARESELAEPMEHRCTVTEHHSIEVGVFDARIVNQQNHQWMRDLGAPAIAMANAWAAEQGIEIHPTIRDSREGGSNDARITVEWDVVVGRGRMRHDPDRFIDGGSRFIWSSRWRALWARLHSVGITEQLARRDRETGVIR